MWRFISHTQTLTFIIHDTYQNMLRIINNKQAVSIFLSTSVLTYAQQWGHIILVDSGPRVFLSVANTFRFVRGNDYELGHSY